MIEALDHPRWRQVMIIEMLALEHNKNMGVRSFSL